MSTNNETTPWNKGKLVGQKLPLKLKEIWAIRVRLQLAENKRDLALFNLAIDSKLRGSDLVKIKVNDISNSGVVSSRAMILQQKTSQPVQFEITEGTRDSITDWISACEASGSDYLFPKQDFIVTTPLDTPVRKNCRAMGFRHRSGQRLVRHPLAPSNKTYTDL